MGGKDDGQAKAPSPKTRAGRFVAITPAAREDVEDSEIPTHTSQESRWVNLLRRCKQHKVILKLLSAVVVIVVLVVAASIVARYVIQPRSQLVWIRDDALDSVATDGSRANVPANTHTSIAFLFAGALRTVTEPSMHGLLYLNGLKAASMGASGPHSRDSFWVTYEERSQSTNQRDYPLRSPSTAERFVINQTLNFLNARVVEILSQNDCSVAAAKQLYACCQDSFQQYGAPRSGPYLQFLWIRRAFEHATAYEQIHNFAYDWFVRIRPDTLLLEPLPALINLPPIRLYVQSNDGGDWSDHFFIVPRLIAPPFVDMTVAAFQPRMTETGACMMGRTPLPCVDSCKWMSANPAGFVMKHWIGIGAPFLVYPLAVTFYKDDGYGIRCWWRKPARITEEGHVERTSATYKPLALFHSTWGVANDTQGASLLDYRSWCEQLQIDKLLPTGAAYIDSNGDLRTAA